MTKEKARKFNKKIKEELDKYVSLGILNINEDGTYQNSQYVKELDKMTPRKAFIEGVIKGKAQARQEELDFLLAITKWRSWDKMSEFAQENIKNRISELKQKLQEEKQ